MLLTILGSGGAIPSAHRGMLGQAAQVKQLVLAHLYKDVTKAPFVERRAAAYSGKIMVAEGLMKLKFKA